MELEGEQFALQFGDLIRISGSVGSIFCRRCIAGHSVYTRSTTMDNTPDLALPPASLEQDACSFQVSLIVQFCRNTGMIEATYKVVDGSYAVNRLLHLLLISNLASQN